MSETMTNTTTAYNKGALSTVSGSDCPYGHTKLHLRAWWNAGREDCNNKRLDKNMCYDKTLKKVGITR